MASNNLEEISKVIGLAKAVDIARSVPFVGGHRWLYVPAKAEAESFIASIIGFPEMEKLCEAYGGTQLTLGCPDRFVAIERARTLMKTGSNISRIAKETGVSLATCYRLAGRRSAAAAA
uniref:helix-turn-helix domain-containing protein n=1 Tax=Gluconobacter thailandicus TaxID=257438 RepID=UPI0009EE7408|nr:helix-turn-helix domain-containing protein [Gluconobacter thailandicus]